MARLPDPGKQRRWLELMRLWQQSRLTVCEFCELRATRAERG
jgi:hypothetical protein